MSATNSNIEQSKAQQDEAKEFKGPNEEGKKTALILIADGSEEIETVVPFDVLIRAGFQVITVGVGLDMVFNAPAASATLSRGLRIIPDHTFLDLPSSITPDVLVLPGGKKGAETFFEQETVQNLIRTTFKSNVESELKKVEKEGQEDKKPEDREKKEIKVQKGIGKKHYIAAICAATKAVVRAIEEAPEDDKKAWGLDEKKPTVTSHPSVEKEVKGDEDGFLYYGKDKEEGKGKKYKGWNYSKDRVVVDRQFITSRGPGTAMEWALKIAEVVGGVEAREKAQEGMML
ncbi:hypothetical protein BJ508DRAFT_419946 [Ascobolus immersus RN42]|uniref:D-lactate dehydratase n=1 Tax=Ascobolus immersus RN42 TaxID=1160509 RepID=A0A3N4H9U5_ASCIM|nr:hypothetical protein BJ508DRAFT_419946 [Ascobolus immersus RN42]